MDLQDREHNTKDGLHIASLAGAWTALVGGFGGMRAPSSGALSFSPKLPPGIIGLSFRMRYRGRIVQVKIHDHGANYSLLAGDPLEITHHGDPLTVSEKEVTRDIPAGAAHAADPALRPRPAAAPHPQRLRGYRTRACFTRPRTGQWAAATGRPGPMTAAEQVSAAVE